MRRDLEMDLNRHISIKSHEKAVQGQDEGATHNLQIFSCGSKAESLILDTWSTVCALCIYCMMAAEETSFVEHK